MPVTLLGNLCFVDGMELAVGVIVCGAPANVAGAPFCSIVCCYGRRATVGAIAPPLHLENSSSYTSDSFS